MTDEGEFDGWPQPTGSGAAADEGSDAGTVDGARGTGAADDTDEDARDPATGEETDPVSATGGDAEASASDGDGGPEIPLPWNTVSEDADAPESDDEAPTATDDGPAADGDDDAPERFEDLRFVGPKTGSVLRESSVSLADLTEKRVAYRELKAAGVNPGVAAKIRREHSLSWSLDGGGTDLDRRSTQIRGLDDEERAWIAGSSGWSDSDAAETDGSGDATDAEAAWRARSTDAVSEADADGTAGPVESSDGSSQSADEAPATAGEAAWRERSAPTPLAAIAELDEEATAELRKAGIGSVRRLATAAPESVADALDVDVERVAAWRRLARDHESS